MSVGGARHTVVISDVHLTQEVHGVGEWLRYRQRRFFPDEDFAELAALLLERVLASGDRLELVLDGDVVDFETPRLLRAGERLVDAPRSEPEALALLDAVVRDHRVFFEQIARVASAGHRVVFVAGNHDAHLALPAVQDALRVAIARCPGGADASTRVLVRPWFHRTDDGVHVEHGHQYDPYCSFLDPLRPLDIDGREIEPTLGSLAFRHLVARMGYFNAYDERSFMLSLPRYLAHWARHYLFSRRSLAVKWLLGALRVLAAMVEKRPGRASTATIRRRAAVARDAYAGMLGLDADSVEEHARLFVDPVDLHGAARALRLDHTGFAALALAGVIEASFEPKIGLPVALGSVALALVHERMAPRRSADAEQLRMDAVTRAIARLYDARAVVFGHTHVPHAKFEDGVVYANSGAWTPALEDTHGEVGGARARGRPVVWLRSDHRSATRIEGGLYRLIDGGLLPTCAVGADGEETTVTLVEPALDAVA